MAGPKYSNKQKERFFDLIDKGGTVRAAAESVGVHPGAAYTWLRNAVLTMQRATPRIYTDAEKAVARELRFTHVTCYAWARKAGIFTSEARRVNPRREEFLRLRAGGLTRTQAAARVKANSDRPSIGIRASRSSIVAGSTPMAASCAIQSASCLGS